MFRPLFILTFLSICASSQGQNPVCYPCGDATKQVADRELFVEDITCGESEDLGLAGLIPPELCTDYQFEVSLNCGCKDINPTEAPVTPPQPTRPPTKQPTVTVVVGKMMMMMMAKENKKGMNENMNRIKPI